MNAFIGCPGIIFIKNGVIMSDTKPNTAITTWSGFIYQGKVAIYHTLKILLGNLYSDNDLQLDAFEDFAILNNKKTISMHQVKAKKSTYYSAYKDAFIKLNDKSIDCIDLNFHIAKNIHDKTVEEIEKLHPKIKIYRYEDIFFIEGIVVKIDTIMVVKKMRIKGNQGISHIRYVASSFMALYENHDISAPMTVPIKGLIPPKKAASYMTMFLSCLLLIPMALNIPISLFLINRSVVIVFIIFNNPIPAIKILMLRSSIFVLS